MKFLFLLFFALFCSLFGSQIEELRWEKNETFLMFLQKNSLPLSIYYNLDNEDKELATEVYADTKFYILKSDNGTIKQVLIPTGSELQLHIYHEKNGTYSMSTTPIIYHEESKELALDLEISPYQDIVNSTGNYLLANEYVNAFKGSIDFKRLRAGTKIVIIYKQKNRLGNRFGNPTIEAALVESRKNRDYIFLYDDRYYNADAKEIEGFFLSTPVVYTRISSAFTTKRWHPILKKYRAHLGIDYAAPTGTPVKAAGDGVITFIGTQNGNGETVILTHDNGYKTLYSHLSRFSKNSKKGKSVKKGTVVAYVGNTGLSTGPHLHFGLYKNNQAINPGSVLKVAKSALKGKSKDIFKKSSEEFKVKLDEVYLTKQEPSKEEVFEYIVHRDNQNI